MLKRFPLLSLTVARAACPTDGPSFSSPSRSGPAGSWQYDREAMPARSRIMPIVFTAVAHGALLFGFLDSAPRTATVAATPADVVDWPAPPKAINDDVIVIDVTDQPVEELRAGDFVPAQPDLLAVPIDNDMTQTFSPVTATPRPDVAPMTTIPVRPGTGLAGGTDGAARIFNPDMLDQMPRATFQPAPRFPAEMRRQVTQATVMVEFIVNDRGTVEQARVIDTTYRGFEAAAVDGVSRWRFKPGIKGGRPVNTRLRVPLVFTVSDS